MSLVQIKALNYDELGRASSSLAELLHIDFIKTGIVTILTYVSSTKLYKIYILLHKIWKFKNILREINKLSFRGSKIDFELKLVDRIFFKNVFTL